MGGRQMVSEAQKKAIKRYQDANYEFIKVRLNKGDKEKLKAKAEKEGKSINSYILDRIL
jgi:predicted HicB family RNase H-like nuclease